jgi:hypothetical protein
LPEKKKNNRGEKEKVGQIFEFSKSKEREQKQTATTLHFSSFPPCLFSSFQQQKPFLAAMAMGQSPTKNFSAVAYDEAGNKRKIALITGVTGQVSRRFGERARESFFSC